MKAKDGRRRAGEQDTAGGAGGEAAEEKAEDKAAREGAGEDIQGCGGEEGEVKQKFLKMLVIHTSWMYNLNQDGVSL